MKKFVSIVCDHLTLLAAQAALVIAAPNQALADGAPGSSRLDQVGTLLQHATGAIPTTGTALIVASAVLDFVFRLVPTVKAQGVIHLLSAFIAGSAEICGLLSDSCAKLSQAKLMAFCSVSLSKVGMVLQILAQLFQKLAELSDKVLPQNLKQPQT